MAAMTRDQAKAIYRAKYWAKPGLYLVAPLSARIAEELLDTGVNMGTGTAGIFLQRLLNALNERRPDYPDVKVDGGDRAGHGRGAEGLPGPPRGPPARPCCSPRSTASRARATSS
jgi:hypothetical protein